MELGLAAIYVTEIMYAYEVMYAHFAQLKSGVLSFVQKRQSCSAIVSMCKRPLSITVALLRQLSALLSSPNELCLFLYMQVPH